LQNCVKGQVQIQSLFDDGNEHIDGDRDPDLGLDGVFRGSEEGFDPQVLLDPLEEGFDLPSAFVEQRDAHGRQNKVIGQKDQMFFLLGVKVLYPAKLVGIAFQGKGAEQLDGLVALESGCSVDIAGIDSAELEILLGPDNEEREKFRKKMEPFKIQISAIHDVERTRLRNQDIEDIDIVASAVGDFDKRRDTSPQVHQRMHLDGGFRFAEGGPRKEGKTQIDCCGIQGIGGLRQLDAEVLMGIKAARIGDQPMTKVGVNPPIPFFVRIGQGAAGDAAPDSQMIELLLPGAQAGFNIPKALSVA